MSGKSALKATIPGTGRRRRSPCSKPTGRIRSMQAYSTLLRRICSAGKSWWPKRRTDCARWNCPMPSICPAGPGNGWRFRFPGSTLTGNWTGGSHLPKSGTAAISPMIRITAGPVAGPHDFPCKIKNNIKLS
uniref:Putative acyltransferase n=1 Tax=uncultured microorganism TaxID=358574 RepID=I3PGB9_9ZZZZ|nr:putative acyltransferase [uncultured microorganism]